MRYVLVCMAVVTLKHARVYLKTNLESMAREEDTDGRHTKPTCSPTYYKPLVKGSRFETPSLVCGRRGFYFP